LTYTTLFRSRYMKPYGITHEQIAMVAVVQREWAAKNPRATMKAPITVEDVLYSRMIAYPFRILQCCLVTDGGGALILTSADRAKDFKTKPGYILGTCDNAAVALMRQTEALDARDGASRGTAAAAGPLPLYGLGDRAFMPHEETGKFIADGHTRPGGK